MKTTVFVGGKRELEQIVAVKEIC